MKKFNTKNLAIIIFFGILLVGMVGIANAQQISPDGGDSFETAVKLEPGNYEGVGLIEEDAKEYFYINVKAGQELKLEGTFKAFSDSWGEEILTLYSEDRKQLAKGGEGMDKGEQTSFSFSWIPNSEKDSYKYYIKRECTWHIIESFSLDISLTDRYDAGAQTDAGDTVEKAMEITSGEYKAYLSGKAGTDNKDFYKMAVKKGETLTVRVTPPTEATMRIAMYDKDRRILKDEYASNPGAIVTNSLAITKSEDIFIGVICDRYCSEELVAYTLNITTEGVAVEEGDEGGALIDTEKKVPTSIAAEKEGPNWGLIIGIIVLGIVIVIIVYFLLKKKRQY
jgi:hypothetical protein